MELKDKLDELNERYTGLVCASRFLANISDPDYVKDARTLERSSATLEESIKAIP